MNPNTRDLVNREEPRRSNNPPSGSLVSFDNMEEEWRDVVGYEGLYMVSSCGRVRNNRRNRILRPASSPEQYLTVSLWKGIIQKTLRIHRLVAEAFIPNPQNKRCVNHMSGNRIDNNISNLEWTTHGENLLHAYRELNRQPPRTWAGRTAELNPNSKAIIQIDTTTKAIVAEYPSAKMAQDITGIHKGNIGMCCRGIRRIAGGFIWKFK